MSEEIDTLVKQRFFKLLEAAGTTELTHVDYKRELFHRVGSENENKKAEAKGYSKILSHIMGMYNTPNTCGPTFPGIHANSYGSSYLVFGIDCKQNKKVVMAEPIDKENDKRGYIDETNLQQQIDERFNYLVDAHYYETNINEADLVNSTLSKLTWFKNGCYGLLEIVHNDTKGPIFAKMVTDKKVGKLKKNLIANKLYVRKQGTTRVIDNKKHSDCDLENEVWAKFDAKYAYYVDRLEDFKKYIKLKRKSFQILVTTPCANVFEKEQKELMTRLSKVKWNAVFDTDQKTNEEDGMYNFFNGKMILPITNILKDEVARLQAEGWNTSTIPNEGAHEKSCLYIFANGDSTVPGRESTNFQLTDVQNLSKILFQHIHIPLQLFVYVLVFNPSTIKSIEEICKGIGKAWEEVKEPSETSDDIYPTSKFLFISYHESLLNLLAKYLESDETYTSAVAPIKQISDFFCYLQQERDDNNEKSYLPGSAGNIIVEDRDIKLMGKYVDLYYCNRGCSSWLSLSGNEAKDEYKMEISTKFWQGFYLTPEALYLHEYDIQNIYVKRKLMIDLVREIRQFLKKLQYADFGKTPLHQVGQNIVQLIHEPSAGGTTVGRSVLWEIRKEYPSMILLNWEGSCKEVLDWLRYLYENCQLPLCILIDTSVVTNMRYEDVESFATTVQKADVRAVILFVQQLPEIDDQRGDQFILQNKLSEDEKSKFDKIMSKAGELLSKTPSKTIALYGLCQFGAKYKLLEKGLMTCQNEGSEQDKMLLLLSAITFSYSHQPLPFYFVARIFKTNPEHCYTELDETLNCLRMARDFLIVAEDENTSDNFHNGIRPVTSFVSNKILEIVFGSKKDYLVAFINQLLSLLDKTNICDQAVTAVTKPLFIQRNITEGTKEKFSRFVNELEKANDIDTTVVQLRKFANAVGIISTDEGPHVRSMLARYLAYRAENINEALQEMRRALNVAHDGEFNSTTSKDSTLLTTAGSLINLKLMRLAKDSVKSFDDILIEAVPLFKDALLILHRAQKYESNCYPFTVEARLLYNYMYLYFNQKCKKVPARFVQYLESTTDDNLKEAAEEAMKKLSHLECLLQKHDLDGYDEKTEEQIADIKMKILSLKIDIQGTQQSVFESMCKEDPWLARGLVDFYFFNMKRRMQRYPQNEQQKPSFEMLDTNAFRNIIDIFCEHISNGLTRSNYRHTILAMIYIYKHGPRMHRGNLTMAEKFAKSWSKQYPDDNRPHYYLALMYLLQASSVAMDEQNAVPLKKTLIQQMKDSYKKCKELCFKKDPNQKLNGYKWHPFEISFVLGDYNNFQALIPKDTKYDYDKVVQEYRLRVFTGRAASIGRGHILWCEELQSEVNISNDIYNKWRKYSSERPLYWFYLQTRTSGFFVEFLFDHDPRSPQRNRKLADSHGSSASNY